MSITLKTNWQQPCRSQQQQRKSVVVPNSLFSTCPAKWKIWLSKLMAQCPESTTRVRNSPFTTRRNTKCGSWRAITIFRSPSATRANRKTETSAPRTLTAYSAVSSVQGGHLSTTCALNATNNRKQQLPHRRQQHIEQQQNPQREWKQQKRQHLRQQAEKQWQRQFLRKRQKVAARILKLFLTESRARRNR